jgi:CheY-like chemotaxis protein
VTPRSEHRVLVVEDNAEERDDLCALLESLGHSPRAVGTVEAALAALDEEPFCACIFDQALPVREGARPLATGGERLVRAARAKDKRRTEEGDHVTPIVAFTSHSERSSFVTDLFEAGVSTFVAKPLSLNTAYFLEKYRGVLARAGRDDHARCSALVQRPAPSAHGRAAPAVVRIAIDGAVTTRGRSVIRVSGAPCDLQDRNFLIVLRAIVARGHDKAGWAARTALGIGEDRAVTTRIREAFRDLVPAGFVILEGDRRGNFRLNPDAVVERVDWEALERHPDAGVQKVAVEQRKRVVER